MWEKALNHQTHKHLSATWCRLIRVTVVRQCCMTLLTKFYLRLLICGYDSEDVIMVFTVLQYFENSHGDN